MTHVIVEPCIGTKSADCVEVCPVNCIHDGGEMFYIDPDECIDCGSCVSTCPVEAIFPEADVPAQWKAFTEKNAQLAKGGGGGGAPAAAPAAQPAGGVTKEAPAASAPQAQAPAVPATPAEDPSGFSPRAPTSPLTLKRWRELQEKAGKKSAS